MKMPTNRSASHIELFNNIIRHELFLIIICIRRSSIEKQRFVARPSGFTRLLFKERTPHLHAPPSDWVIRWTAEYGLLLKRKQKKPDICFDTIRRADCR